MSTGSNKQWEAITLSSICSTAKNIKWNEERDDREYRYIDLTSVDRVSHTIVSPQVINKSNAPSRAQKIVVTNDVLFATTRPTLRRYCLIGSDFNNQICSTGYCVIRPNQTRILPSWIYYLLTSDAFYNYIEPLQTGATYPAVTDKDVLKYAVPLPSLSEQQRIVGILDAEFEKIDALKANAEKNLQNAKDLFQSALKKELEPKQGWETSTFSDVVDVINGRAYSKEELLSKGKYRVLRVGNFFTNDSWYYSDLELEEDKYCEKGDLLYAWSASFGPRIWDGEKVIYHYHIWKMLPSSSLDKYYLLYWLQSTYLTSQVMSNLHGTTMNHITKGIMEATTIKYPSCTLQQSIVSTLNELGMKCQLLQDNYTQTIALCDDLKQALLRKAFNGEL